MELQSLGRMDRLWDIDGTVLGGAHNLKHFDVSHFNTSHPNTFFP